MTAAVAISTAAPPGLTADEYALICARLGRAPNAVETRCFQVMWSEHCAYKHSREVLRQFPTRGPGVLQGPGENAGVVAIDETWALAWKMESHNHPSAVDPYNGAATGVGGIIRDVLAMGARPIALLDSLRFGPLGDPQARRLLEGVVAGIAGYGNSIGVPTVGGELAVDAAYAGAPLVNVACLGLVRVDRIARSRADQAGTVLLYAGARTGRDGIGGAAFASEVLDEAGAEDDRAAIQIGDPFAGKCLVEATLEAWETGRVLALQDMGAGGLTCAAAEMAAHGGTGVLLELNRVPLREREMAAAELLLSESQERMLLVVGEEHAEEVAAVYRRWGLVTEIVGRVTADGRFRALHRGDVVVDLPAELLVGAPASAGQTPRLSLPPTPRAASTVRPETALLRLLAAPEVACRAHIYEQYDHMVQVRTVVRPGEGAAVLRLPEIAPAALAMTADGNGRWCAADPFGGGTAAVLEAAANLACVGAAPLAVTDCLNFGNPGDPAVFSTFSQVVEGMAEACRVLGVPVVGGNVSFYNEGPAGPVLPTPVVAMVGLIPEIRGAPRAGEDGDALVLLGAPGGRFGGSLYAREIGGEAAPGFHGPDPAQARRTLECVREAVRQGVIVQAHDISDGGIAVTAAECCLRADCGAEVSVGAHADVDSALFGEGGTRIVAATPRTSLPALEELGRTHGVPVTALGRLTGRRLRITAGGERVIDLSLRRVRQAWMSLERGRPR